MDKTKIIASAIVGAGLLVGGGIAIDSQVVIPVDQSGRTLEVIQQDVDVQKEIDGVLQTVKESKDFVKETEPVKTKLTPKDEYTERLEQSLEFYKSEVERNQQMVDDIKAELKQI